jgi:type IV secretory pathway TrbL component
MKRHTLISLLFAVAPAIVVGLVVGSPASAAGDVGKTAAVGASASDPAAARTNAAALFTGGYHQIENLGSPNQCVDAPGGAFNVVLRITKCSGSDT